MTKCNANLTVQSNLIRFSKFWHPPHLKCIAALSMDIQSSNFVHITRIYTHLFYENETFRRTRVTLRCIIISSFRLLEVSTVCHIRSKLMFINTKSRTMSCTAIDCYVQNQRRANWTHKDSSDR